MPELYDVALVVDGELGRRAIQAVDEYLKEYGDTEYRAERDWPISRSQIAGLRQIAATEPSKVASFASHQQKKGGKAIGTDPQRGAPARTGSPDRVLENGQGAV